MFKIDLGVKAKDNVTGFSGIVTGRVEYLTGCRQYLITPKAGKDKLNEAYWFDEDRLINSKTKNPGGPQMNCAPVK